jgi:hypothetical protein
MGCDAGPLQREDRQAAAAGKKPMSPLAHVRRVVLGHTWDDLEEWVCALDELADLTDEEIDRLSAGKVPAEPSARVAA